MKVPKCLIKIAPRWSKRIAEASSLGELYAQRSVDGKRLDIDVSQCCIVGEAHGLRAKELAHDTYDPNKVYYGVVPTRCTDCETFARQFSTEYFGDEFRSERMTDDPANQEGYELFEPFDVYDPEQVEALKVEFTKHFNEEHI